MLSDNVITALFVAIPATITSIGAAIVAVKQSNKASARTDEKVEAGVDAVATKVAENAAVVADKLVAVHETVNGNFTALQSKHDDLARENTALKEELAAHKATAKRPKKGAP